MSIDSFLSYIASEKRYSRHTVTAYKTDLYQFQQYIQKEYEIRDFVEVKAPMLRSWLVLLMEEGKTSKSINRKLTSVKSFFKYLNQRGKISVNPIAKTIALKIPKKLPVFVRNSEIENLLEKIEFEDNHSGIRSKLILEILYSCGIRLDELINIQHKDIDSSNKLIKILGKRNKERLVPVYPKVLQLIDAYRSVKLEDGLSVHTYLLLTDKGKKMYPKLVYRTVNTYLSRVTTISKKSPHVLRHTFATHMLNNGADLNSIKEILGHASLSATQVYTHNSIEKLKKAYKLAHPRA